MTALRRFIEGMFGGLDDKGKDQPVQGKTEFPIFCHMVI